MRTFSKKKLVVTAVAATVLVGTGTAAFAYWTSQGTGSGTAATAAEAGKLTVKQISSPEGMYPGDEAQNLDIAITNEGPNRAQVSGVRAVPTVTLADGKTAGTVGTCSPSDYQVNGSQLPDEGSIDVNWTAVELDANATQTSENTVHFFDKTVAKFGDKANQDGCKGATLVFAYTAR